MTYTDTLLASGERILLRERQHWFILAGNARWGILALVAAIILLLIRIVTGASNLLIDILGIVTLVLFVGGLIQIGWCWLRYQNEEYVITNRRIIHTGGVVNKHTSDSSLEKVNDAELNEGVFGRIFGFGDLTVLTASEEGDERLRMLRDAKAFKKAMVEAKHELELELTRPTMPPLRSGEPRPATEAGQPVAPPPAPAGMPVAPMPVAQVPVPAAAAPVAPAPAPAAPPPAAMSSDEVTEALSRLGDLRDRGIVTPEEFEAKKRELLERL